jgi:type VI secretion system protein ImpE
MTAEQLLEAGQLDEAIEKLNSEVRNDPTNLRRRTFLFELLCFAGEYSRAEKHLDVLSTSGPQSELGALLYKGALAAERTRQEMFEADTYPKAAAGASIPSRVNGKPYASVGDTDPRIRGNIELIVAGSYMWLPLHMIETVRTEPPTRLRDLLWLPATVQTTAAFQGQELSSVLIPVLSPGSWKSNNPDVRLGRMTLWEENRDKLVIPFGQKLVFTDEEEWPILEIREIQMQSTTIAS